MRIPSCYSNRTAISARSPSRCSTHLSPEAISALVATLLFAMAVLSGAVWHSKVATMVFGIGATLAVVFSILRWRSCIQQKPPPSPPPVVAPAPSSSELCQKLIHAYQKKEAISDTDLRELAKTDSALFMFAGYVALNVRSVALTLLQKIHQLNPKIFREKNQEGQTLVDIAISEESDINIIRFLIQAHGEYRAQQALNALDASPKKPQAKYRLSVLTLLHASTDK